MTVPLRARAALLLAAWLVGGCATWDGGVALSRPFPMRGEPLPGAVFVERPRVVDRDPERDFAALAATLAAELQIEQREYLRASQLFKRTLRSAERDAYRLCTEVTVYFYQPKRLSDGVAIMGGLLLPPLLGMVWALPLNLGQLDAKVVHVLRDPAGKPIRRGSQLIHVRSAALDHRGGQAFGSAFSSFVFRVSGDLGRRPSAAARVGAAATGRPWARSQVLVFDVVDLTGAVDERTRRQIRSALVSGLYRSRTHAVARVTYAGLGDRAVSAVCRTLGCQAEAAEEAGADGLLAIRIARDHGFCALTVDLYQVSARRSQQALVADTDCSRPALLEAAQRLAAQLR